MNKHTPSSAQAAVVASRFPEVALQWFQALLTNCEAPRHGVDLFGRDALLLGRCARPPSDHALHRLLCTLLPNRDDTWYVVCGA